MVTLFALLLACPPATDAGPLEDDADTDADADADADTDSDTDTDADALDGECPDAVQWGGFLIDANEDYAWVAGSLSNGIVPVTVLTPVLESGDCAIWRQENPYCDGGCDSGYTCDLTGECVPYPVTQDLGTVTVTGLVQAVSMDPVNPGYNYYDTSLPNPPWVAGEPLTLQTGGGAYDPVTAYGVAPVTLVPVTMAWQITPGEPLPIEWDAPTEAVRTELILHLRIDQHGTTPSSIVCIFEDDGAAEVPADALEMLMSAGVTGFPAGDLARRTADATDIGDGGCIDFVATSSHLATIGITGYTPCTRDQECPEGTTCNEDLERCE